MHFSQVTGISANTEKSSIYRPRVKYDMRQRLLELTGHELGKFPMRYVGLPFSPRKWIEIECQQLCTRITEKIRANSNRHLYYEGKQQIINSVLFSLHNYWGAVFLLPQSVIKEVDKKSVESSFWGSTAMKNKVALVERGNVCRPKKQGGLNI